MFINNQYNVNLYEIQRHKKKPKKIVLIINANANNNDATANNQRTSTKYSGCDSRIPRNSICKYNNKYE